LSKIKELQHLSLATTYEVDNAFDSDKFIKMKLRVCHDGINPNNSAFALGDMEKAKDSIVNIPILANVIFDEEDNPQFGGHDMEIEENKTSEGEYKLIYKETPIGLVPESCNYTIDKFNDKNYVFVDCYIWKEYSNYAQDIVERDKDIKLSMEIMIDGYSFNSKDQIYNITDYRYQGITFLNKDFGTGMENALATTEQFSEDNSKDKFIMMMQELKNTLCQHNINNTNTEEGGKELVDKKLELLQKYNLTLETILFSVEELSLEEIESKIIEHFALLVSQKREEIANALKEEKYTDRWGDQYPKYSFEDNSDSEVFAYDRQDNYKLFGFTYSMTGDSVTIDFATKKRKKFEIVDFIDGETATMFNLFPQEAIDYAVSDKEKELTEQFSKPDDNTDAFSEITEKFNVLQVEKDEVIEKFVALESEKNTISEEFEALKTKITEYETNISTLTEQFNTIKSENETLIQSNQSLAEFKSNTEIAQQKAFENQQIQLKAELVENFSKVLTAEEVKSIQDKDLSTEEMEKEFKLIYADKDLQVKFNKKPKKVETEIPINSFTCKKKDDWTSCIKK